MARLTTVWRKHSDALLALPAVFWLGAFFFIPLLIVMLVSFLSRGQGGLPELPFTFAHYNRSLSTFFPIFERSVLLSLWTTLICLVLGYPLALFIRTRTSLLGKRFALFLVILPFWTNFLVRIYAWRFLLGREGIINGALINLGITSEALPLLNTEFSVLLGLVYGFLPFMVLPIYAVLERFDFRYVEAARDLGASNWTIFWRIMLPMTLGGVLAGCVLVFIPAIGSYVAPDLLGGTQGMMIGNLLTGQFKGAGNLPLGAAMSVVILLMVLLPVIVYIRMGKRADGAAT